MTECKARLPLCDYKYSKEDWGPTGSAQTKGPVMLNALPPKEDFLAEWGEPSETITVSEDEVTFVYKTVDVGVESVLHTSSLFLSWLPLARVSTALRSKAARRLTYTSNGGMKPLFCLVLG